MKTLKNLAMATLMSGAMAVSNPTYSQQPWFQKQEITKEQKLLPHLNFYFETGEYMKYPNIPEFKKHIRAWLCACLKEDKKGRIWFYYGDTNDDGFYDHVIVEKSDNQIKSQEKFYFNLDTKKIDYVLNIHEFCPEAIDECDRIIRKSYNGIDQKESYQIGEDFSERIQKFSSVQKEFSRFNQEPLEELVREEYDYRLKLVDGKLVGNSGTPIKKFLSEEEIKEVEDYYRDKPERERLKREQEERAKALKIEQEKIAKAEYEKREKIRKEQEEKLRIEKEAKKITARLELGGGITINSKGGHIGPFLGITPKLTNKKGKGFAMGIDMFVMSSKIEFETYGGIKDKRTQINTYQILVSHTEYTNSLLEKTANRLGLNMGYVSPAFEIFANAGFLGRKRQITTTAVTEEYILESNINGTKQGASSFKTEKENWETNKFFEPFYFGLGMEIFPFSKKDDSKKNISFSLDWLISKRTSEIFFTSPAPLYYPSQSIIKAGLKYTFKK